MRANPRRRSKNTPFRSLKRVNWSITGAGGATSDEERRHVFRLAEAMPNITGVFMDDFFQFDAGERPQWLAGNSPEFPITLTITFPGTVIADQLELAQSDWRTGDYRSRDFAVDLSAAGAEWLEAAKGTLPNAGGAVVRVGLGEGQFKALRLRILGTHDTKDARSCGLRGIRLWNEQRVVSLTGAKVEASSTYPGHDARNVLPEESTATRPAPASLSVEQLRRVREQLVVGGRRLDLGVTLYTHQLDPRIVPHLELCDVISLWTWKSQDLAELEANFEKLKAMAPSKRIRLGCYMWDFGINKPMPLDRMRKQCELGLTWLRQGRIDGMIFLATNLCDLKLETVEWTRKWIAQVGDRRLSKELQKLGAEFDVPEPGRSAAADLRPRPG